MVTTLNPEIFEKFPGRVRVVKKKSGQGRVAGTRQSLPRGRKMKNIQRLDDPVVDDYIDEDYDYDDDDGLSEQMDRIVDALTKQEDNEGHPTIR